jgi:aldose sugar dehydrogenase
MAESSIAEPPPRAGEHAHMTAALWWHAAAAALLLVLPTHLLVGARVWETGAARFYGVFGLPLAYLAAAAVVTFAVRGRGVRQALRSLIILAVVLAGFFLVAVVLRDLWYSRLALLAGLALAAGFIMAPALLTRRLLWPGGAALALAAAALLTVGGATADPIAADRVPTVSSRIVRTSHGVFRTVEYWWYVQPVANGGGIDALGDGYILATGDGDVYRLHWASDSDSLSVEQLPIRIPLDRAAFAAAAGSDVQTALFRVADSLVRMAGDSIELVASHHHWHDDAQCFTIRISVLLLAADELDRGVAADRWRTLYDTQPCLPILRTDRVTFAGIQMGGRLADYGNGHLLMTVGDHGFNGWQTDRALSQDPTADYGRTLEIDREGHATHLSMGQRNPQGLHLDAAGRIWTTEHGPQGGDALHRIIPGSNYGWPYVTYGTDYGDVVWPLQGQGDWNESAFRPATFAWVPSVGISSLIQVRRAPVAEWRGDLLIGSLPARSLYRVRLDGDRVVYVEPIQIGSRIRDLVEGPDGRIIMWVDGGGIIRMSAATPESGEALFARCVGCHSSEPGVSSALGPGLHGVYGRVIAGDAGFAYSPAFRSLTGRWTVTRLDEFLADPQAFAPGNTMVLEPIADARERAALINYLVTLR